MARRRRGDGNRSANTVGEENVVTGSEPAVMPKRKQGRGRNGSSRPADYTSRVIPSRRETAGTPPGSGIVRRVISADLLPPVRRSMAGLVGRVIETNPFGEPIVTQRNQIIQLPIAGPALYCENQISPALAINYIKTFGQQIFQLLIQQVVRKGKFVNGTLSGPDVFQVWLNNYAAIFLMLRTMEGMLSANGVNLSTDKIVQAGSPNRIRIEQDLQRLASFPVPQEFVDMLERYCGVFMLDAGGPGFWPVVDTAVSANAGLDFTLSASWTSYLSDAESLFTNLTTSGTPLDQTLILNVMGTLFQPPVIGPKAVSFNTAEFDQWQSMVAEWQDTGGTPGFVSVPQMTDAAGTPLGTFPLLARCGRPSEDWELSFLRAAPTSAVAATGIKTAALSATLGYVGPLLAQQFRLYNADGTVIAFNMNGSGIAGGVANSMSIFTWAPWAGAEIFTPQTLLGQVADWDVFTSSGDLGMDETILQYTKIFHLIN